MAAFSMSEDGQPPVLLYLPQSHKIINLSAISSIDSFPSRPRKMDFPELKTRKKRKTHTDWMCVVTLWGGESLTLRGDEAQVFLEAIKPFMKILELPVHKEEPVEET